MNRPSGEVRRQACAPKVPGMRTLSARLTVAVTALLVGLLAPSFAFAAEPETIQAASSVLVLADADEPLASVRDEYAPGRSSPVELLPAWRWRNVAPRADYGKFDIGEVASSGISTGLTSLASVLWNMVLWITAAVFSFDLVSQAAQPMDRAFLALARPVVNSGIWVLLLFGALAVALRRAFTRGDVAGAMRTMLLSLAPLALLMVLVSNAERGLDTADGYAADGPAGLAVRAVRGMDNFGATFSSAVVTGFGLIDTSGAMSGNSDTGPLGCAAYSSAMANQYRAVTGSAPGTAGDQLVVLSNLWERGFLDPWGRIQFGEAVTSDGQPYRDYVGCRQLEQNRNTRGDQQYELTLLAAQLHGTPVSPPSPGLFSVGSRQNDRTATVMFWAGCRYDGTWRADPGFAAIGQLDADWCAEAWATGSPDGGEVQPGRLRRGLNWVLGPIDFATPLNLGDRLNLTSSAIVEARQGPAGSDSYEAGKLVLDYWGANSGERLVYSFIILLTAVIYLYALGAISLGALLAKFGLIVLIALLPLTLLLMAVPSSRDRGGAGQLGAKMLRVTGAMVATNFVFTVFLVTLIQLITLISSLLAGLGDGLRFLGPIVAVVLFKMLARMVGLGDLTNLSGALGMTAGAALRAGGAGGLAGDMQRRADGSSLGTSISKRKKDLTSRTGTATKNTLFAGGRAVKSGALAAGSAPFKAAKKGNQYRKQRQLSDLWSKNKKPSESAKYAIRRSAEAIEKRKAAGTDAILSAENAKTHHDKADRDGAIYGAAPLYEGSGDAGERRERLENLNRLSGLDRAVALSNQVEKDLDANSKAYRQALDVDESQVPLGSTAYLGVSKTSFANTTGVPAEIVYGSALGAAPLVAPRAEFSTKNMNQDQALSVLTNPAYHIDSQVYDFLKAEKLSEDEMNAALHMVVSAAGYDGVDFLAANRINTADPKVVELLVDDTKREQMLSALPPITLDSRDLRRVVNLAKNTPSSTTGGVVSAQLDLMNIVDVTRDGTNTSAAEMAHMRSQIDSLVKEAQAAIKAGDMGRAEKITQRLADYSTPILNTVDLVSNIDVTSNAVTEQMRPGADLEQVALYVERRFQSVAQQMAAHSAALRTAESAAVAPHHNGLSVKQALEQLAEKQLALLDKAAAQVGASMQSLDLAKKEIESENRRRDIDPRKSPESKKPQGPPWRGDYNRLSVPLFI